MHFGEYELSPSLISLSPLPSAHWKAFQRLPIRSSSWCYPPSTWPRVDHSGFASTPPDWAALFRLAFASAPYLRYLTLPGKVTRRFIMQNGTPSHLDDAPTACRQTGSGSISLHCSGFFSPFPHGTGSLSVSRGVFSLTGWAPQFHARFLVPRATQDALGFNRHSCNGFSPSL